MIGGGKQRKDEKNRPQFSFVITNLACSYRELNGGLCGEKPAPSRLDYAWPQ
jgi:hypothetical protein